MRVHDDTVSCVRMSGGSNERMLTASWDSTVKLWGIGEGRGSWAAGNAGDGLCIIECRPVCVSSEALSSIYRTR